MNGQWIGEYRGSSNGKIIVNTDERGSCFQGIVYLIDNNDTIPGCAVSFVTSNTSDELVFRSKSIQAIEPRTARICSWEDVQRLFPGGGAFPHHADFWGSWSKNILKLHWTTDLGVTGECSLPKSRAGTPSKLYSLEKNWAMYKELAGDLTSEVQTQRLASDALSKRGERRYLFRGQNRRWRLRTSFHRAGRADVDRYRREDIPLLYRHLSARTRHLFDLEDPDEHGAFLNLAQHYGYPTPLLDWTYSPYVAAFFAYRGITNQTAEHAKPGEMVRVLVFDQGQWTADQNELGIPLGSALQFSVGEFMAVGNERMIPQQAVSTITNIDDVESYISSREADNHKYLFAVDMPWADRRKVISELSNMGITAGALFPGLDGACEELRERNFSI